MMMGIDVLRQQEFNLLQGKRFVLLSHQAALTADGSTSAQLLRRHLGKQMIALYGPEHGFFGQAGAGESVASRRHPDWDIPVFSLYGEDRDPTPEMLRQVDAVIFDLQDLGVRCYTYLATLRNMLTTCATNQVEVIVTDRPIPLPNIVDGPLTTPDCTSFVAPCPLPMVYGMTPGESAQWIRKDLGLKLNLTVVPMEGWARADAAWDGTRPAFMPPSPAIKGWESAMCYAATVFSEALPGIDCGRGTNLAFRVLGAPWLEAERFCALPACQKVPGVTFRPYSYMAVGGPYAGQELNGIRLTVTDPTKFKPVETSVTLLHTMAEIYGSAHVWQHQGARRAWFDALYGTDRVRRQLVDGDSLSAMFDSWRQESEAFCQARQAALLYA